MITLNIYIGSDGKSISTSSSTITHSQEDLPSPISQNALGTTSSEMPTPLDVNHSMNTHISSSTPHPEGFGSSLSMDSHLVPNPLQMVTKSSSIGAKMPRPMDSKGKDSASPATKPKPKTSTAKRKPGSK